MEMLRGFLLLLVISSVMLVMNTEALRWSTTPINGAGVYPCKGRDLRLDWDYSLDYGDVVTSTEWTFQGRSQEMLAVLVHGNFLPTATFSHRVTHLPRAGILLSDVNFADSGNYSITVTGHNSTGDSFSETRTVVVQVADALMTDDHELHAHVEPAAVRDPATDQFAISLACGHFMYAGNPPIHVEWTTPEGQNLSSTSYDNGYFKLQLPGPVIEGEYICGISSSTLNASCLHGDNIEASVHLDPIMARLAILEGEQNYLLTENSQKDNVISNLTDTMQTLLSKVSQLEHENAQKDGAISQLNNSLQFLESKLYDRQMPVRLVNGANSRQGRVEIFALGKWGTVCDDDWDNNDAKVVCRMLGLSTSGAQAMVSAYFGEGSGSILLDQVNCTGNEPSLLACPANPLGQHDCSHSEDAGVICH